MARSAANEVSTPGSRRHIATISAEAKVLGSYTGSFYGQHQSRRQHKQPQPGNMLELLGAFAQGGM